MIFEAVGDFKFHSFQSQSMNTLIEKTQKIEESLIVNSIPSIPHAAASLATFQYLQKGHFSFSEELPKRQTEFPLVASALVQIEVGNAILCEGKRGHWKQMQKRNGKTCNSGWRRSYFSVNSLFILITIVIFMNSYNWGQKQEKGVSPDFLFFSPLTFVLRVHFLRDKGN